MGYLVFIILFFVTCYAYGAYYDDKENKNR